MLVTEIIVHTLKHPHTHAHTHTHTHTHTERERERVCVCEREQTCTVRVLHAPDHLAWIKQQLKHKARVFLLNKKYLTIFNIEIENMHYKCTAYNR